jgi:hypothetical protein
MDHLFGGGWSGGVGVRTRELAAVDFDSGRCCGGALKVIASCGRASVVIASCDRAS